MKNLTRGIRGGPGHILNSIPGRSRSHFEQHLMYHARDMYKKFGDRPNDVGLLETPGMSIIFMKMFANVCLPSHLTYMYFFSIGSSVPWP